MSSCSSVVGSAPASSSRQPLAAAGCGDATTDRSHDRRSARGHSGGSDRIADRWSDETRSLSPGEMMILLLDEMKSLPLDEMKSPVGDATDGRCDGHLGWCCTG